jgi:MFS family permease
MSRLLNHFSLQGAKWNESIVVALIFIWAAVLACVISSILTQPFDRKQRLFWIAMVILLPFLGVLAYLPFAFRKEELPHIFQRKRKRSRRSKPPSSSVES